MEIILLERIDRLGQMGDIVRVKNGYARNYLFPQKKALRKTKENMAVFESKRKEYAAYNLKIQKEAEEISQKMAGLAVVIVRQAAETGQLYGSVNVRDIAEAIQEAGFHIERRQIALNLPFKHLGIFDVRVDLHPDVSQTVRVNIARSADDAKHSEKKEAQAAEKAAAIAAAAETAAQAAPAEAPAAEAAEPAEKPAKKATRKKAAKPEKPAEEPAAESAE